MLRAAQRLLCAAAVLLLLLLAPLARRLLLPRRRRDHLLAAATAAAALCLPAAAGYAGPRPSLALAIVAAPFLVTACIRQISALKEWHPAKCEDDSKAK